MRRNKSISIYDFREARIEEEVSKLRPSEKFSSKVDRTVKKIIKDVKKDGNKAVFEYTLKLDNVLLTKDTIQISAEDIKNAYSHVSKQQISAIKFAKRRIEKFEQAIMKSTASLSIEENGIKINQRIVPIDSVGCYVPGGNAVYVSSLLMTVIPAKVAGVNRIVVTSPPSKNGNLPFLLIVAADICGVNEFYKIGGSQAIAALAYGTETIKSVDKIVGPGNIYVTAAKLILSGVVSIDLPAGPSELLIIADESANAEFVTRDLISQAEHRNDSVAGLLTNSPMLAQNVKKLLNEYVVNLTRGNIISDSLSKNGFIVLCKDISQMIKFANLFAAEHLEIMAKNPSVIAKKITSAGLILLGSYSPSAVTDYCVGTNHVLPTGGFARASSGLSSLDFVKRVDVVECSKTGLSLLRESASILALSEGLVNHSSAIDERFKADAI